MYQKILLNRVTFPSTDRNICFNKCTRMIKKNKLNYKWLIFIHNWRSIRTFCIHDYVLYIKSTYDTLYIGRHKFYQVIKTKCVKWIVWKKVYCFVLKKKKTKIKSFVFYNFLYKFLLFWVKIIIICYIFIAWSICTVLCLSHSNSWYYSYKISNF